MQGGNSTLLRNRLRVILRSLPQYCFVQERVDQWIEHVLSTDPERAEMHANKLGGFSSSEIGILVSNSEGIHDPSGSAHEIISAKLLFSMPDQSDQFRRDIMMEPIHRQLFIERHERLGCTIDNDLLYRFMNAQGPRKWMRYCPDDVVVMTRMAGQPRAVVDYHHPVTVHDSERIEYGHLCQLHQGRLVAEHNNFPIDMLWVSRLNYETFTPVVSNIQYDPVLAERIIEAGDRYWNEFVMSGEVPPRLESVSDSAMQFESNLVRQIFPVAPGETNIDSGSTAVEVLHFQQGVPVMASAMRG